jgi:hypothetical protein
MAGASRGSEDVLLPASRRDTKVTRSGRCDGVGRVRAGLSMQPRCSTYQGCRVWVVGVRRSAVGWWGLCVVAGWLVQRRATVAPPPLLPCSRP